MHYTIEHLEHLMRIKMYCRLSGQSPKEGTVLHPYGNPEDRVYRINNTNVIFSAETVTKIVLDKFGAEIYLS